MGAAVLATATAVLAAAGCTSSSASPGSAHVPSANLPVGAAAPWTGTRLAAGLLAAKDFGPGYTTIENGLSDTGSVLGDGAVPTPIAKLGCYWTVNGALRSGPISKADEYVANPDAHGAAIGAHAYAFLGGAAATTLANDRSALAKCTNFTTEVGTAKLKLTESVSVTAKPGLGNEAFEIQDRESSSDYGTHYIRILVARYGDVVLWTTLDTTDSASTSSYDLAGKIQAMAGKLHLG